MNESPKVGGMRKRSVSVLRERRKRRSGIRTIARERMNRYLVHRDSRLHHLTQRCWRLPLYLQRPTLPHL